MLTKTFTPTQDMINAAKAVFAAKAWVETIKPTVNGYKKGVLARHQWHIAKQWVGRRGEKDRIILDPADSYLLSDQDAQVYYREVNEARKAAGLHVKSEDMCPLLVAEHAEVKAIWGLFDAMEGINGVTQNQLLCAGLDKYKEMTELMLKLLAPYC